MENIDKKVFGEDPEINALVDEIKSINEEIPRSDPEGDLTKHYDYLDRLGEAEKRLADKVGDIRFQGLMGYPYKKRNVSEMTHTPTR